MARHKWPILPRAALALVSVIPALIWGGPVRAQQAASPGWQFTLTPYLWASGITGSMDAANPRIPSQSGGASFGDLLSHLNSVPIMFGSELRYGRFGVNTDLIILSIKTDLPTKDVRFSGADVTLTELVATVLPNYRVIDAPSQQLDLGIGVRVVAMWTKLAFGSGALPGFEHKASPSWAVPLFGARYHADIAERWGFTLYADAGSDGSNPTWQAMGTIDYRATDWLTLRAGYRHLQIDHESDGLRVDTGTGGPIIGATIRF